MKYIANGARLNSNLKALSEFGKNQTGGIDRALGSESYFQGAQWLKEAWTHMGLTVSVDAIANIWAKRPGTEPLRPIVIGSHHDAVPDGGKFDGALGTLMAAEAVESLIEQSISTRHPICIVSLTAEEPNPFNLSTLGSKVLSGRLGKSDLIDVQSTADGRYLRDAIAKLGGDLSKVDEIQIKKGTLAAFLECHIEQGRILFDKGDSVAAVTCITGIYRETIHIHGEANHAGTTLRRDRHDAFLGASELSLMIETLLSEIGDEIAGTVGYVKVLPNSANIIPGDVELIIDIRTCEPAKKARFIKGLDDGVCRIEKTRGLKIERKIILDQDEMPMSPLIVNAVCDSMKESGEKELRMVSMAGHDAANMARVTPAGMLFVQSVNGKSHCAEEFTEEKYISAAANVFLTALLRIDKELD